MGKFYRDANHLFEIHGAFWDRLLRDEKIGARMAAHKLIFKLLYNDPDCEITLDLKNPPTKPGYFGTCHLGACELKPDAWSKQSADHSHRFWHGLENPGESVAKGRVTQGGNVVAMLKFLPDLKPAFQVFPSVLGDLGYQKMIIK